MVRSGLLVVEHRLRSPSRAPNEKTDHHAPRLVDRRAVAARLPTELGIDLAVLAEPAPAVRDV